MKAATITIGTEILIGQIVDTNAAYLGKQLNNLGIEVVKNISISDFAILTVHGAIWKEPEPIC